MHHTKDMYEALGDSGSGSSTGDGSESSAVVVTKAIQSRLIPELADLFQLDASALMIQDLFMAKYSVEPGGLAALEAHCDGSEFSFVVALNDLAEYAGGGTQFLEYVHVPKAIPTTACFPGATLTDCARVCATAGRGRMRLRCIVRVKVTRRFLVVIIATVV